MPKDNDKKKKKLAAEFAQAALAGGAHAKDVDALYEYCWELAGKFDGTADDDEDDD